MVHIQLSNPTTIKELSMSIDSSTLSSSHTGRVLVGNQKGVHTKRGSIAYI